ncbi:MAG: cytochrome B6 [Nitrospinaceae bacterium]|jgi:formate dehydrogenase subunit gamma|nr:cytochrome B6 [Nitrospinaceae bacterium]MBT3435702.1 cytochrome B6 [Nitrospinaceae bacterium]MBT3820594.1 cytochrome B6 [Nitrospinaceae bacterium]MBT4092608.1 cytochrome B6 [Nitrospinaceae bacterium]MBT4430344.1 cytochrome B6 [Nitrospinaceae bacterium]
MSQATLSKKMTTPEHQLSVEQIKEMREKRIKKHDSASVLLHWFNAACWLFLVATGLATISNPAYAIVPIEWTRLMRTVFGGSSGVIFWHVAIGLLWVGVLSVHILAGWRSLTLPFLKNNFLMDRDDVMWLINRAKRILGKDVKLPPQGPYNAGQKIFGIVVTGGSIVILLSGLALTFRSYLPETAWVAWALPVHLFAVGAVCAGLCVHIYMGGVFPEEKQAFFSMFTGEVNELYAYRHHKKWYDEIKEEEAAWEERLRIRLGETTPQAHLNTGDEKMENSALGESDLSEKDPVNGEAAPRGE